MEEAILLSTYLRRSAMEPIESVFFILAFFILVVCLFVVAFALPRLTCERRKCKRKKMNIFPFLAPALAFAFPFALR